MPDHTLSPESRPGGAPGDAAAAPLAFVVDEESSIRRFVSLVLQGCGVDAMEFADGAAFRAARSARPPDIIFLDVSLDAPDAIHSIESLGRAGYQGSVQLMSNRGMAVLENVKVAGEQHSLKMLPALKKPFETSAIQKILHELKLGYAPPAAARIGLDQALKNDWLEFWFQPKIDLRRKQLTGAEAFPRVRHPQHGILLPDSFIPGANEASLLKLSERAVASALEGGRALAKFGGHLRISVNVALDALAKLPVGDIVRKYHAEATGWPGLIIDVVEDQVIPQMELVIELAKTLARHNVRLAVDDFGRGYDALSKFKELPFAEMKLDRAFVSDCRTDKVNAPICKTAIDLAHSYNALAVGIGVEKASDVLALVSMGCDIAQGFLLGQPMPLERFIALLKQRAHVRPAAVAETTAAAQP